MSQSRFPVRISKIIKASLAVAISMELLVFSAICFSSTINPETDLIYLGAFRLPDENSNGTSWEYGGTGMTFRPTGDPAGPSDGYPGSLFGIGHPYESCASEFTIPVPVVSVSKNVDDLPVAETLQGFADVTEGRQTYGLTGTVLGDIQYFPAQGVQAADKLYWVVYEYYLPEETQTSHGWSEPDLSSLNAVGMWRLNGFHFAATSKYLFEIPSDWADEYAPGKYLAAGRNRHANGGSWGPALYAFGPWNDGNPPANGSSVDAVEFLHYEFDNWMKDFGSCDDFPDGAWIEVGNKSAVALAGIKSFRTRASGREYYGDAQPDGCWDKGYQAEPYYGCILFYDPFMFAKAAQGAIDPNQIQPYAIMNVEDYMFNQGCRTDSLAGVGYDRANNILYVVEKYVEDEFGKKPVVHAFRVEDQDTDPDLEPPTVPAGLRTTAVTSTQVDLAWNPSADNNRLVGYVVFRNGWPVATTTVNSYSDDKVNPNGFYRYSVLAWDARDNRSERSAIFGTTTPAGADDRIPLISEIRHADLSDTGIRIMWTTDELSDSVVAYHPQYDYENILTVRNDTMTRSHEIALAGLPPGTSYSYSISSTDASGNTNEFPDRDFDTSPEGTDLNFAPVLNGIGAKKVLAGQTLEFTVDADDLDGDTLTYGASGVPTGASFTAGDRRFAWNATSGDEGLHQVVFTVDDGDQTDSETVPIFVVVEGDSDGDGYDDDIENMAGTDPLDEHSIPTIVCVNPPATGCPQCAHVLSRHERTINGAVQYGKTNAAAGTLALLYVYSGVYNEGACSLNGPVMAIFEKGTAIIQGLD